MLRNSFIRHKDLNFFSFRKPIIKQLSSFVISPIGLLSHVKPLNQKNIMHKHNMT